MSDTLASIAAEMRYQGNDDWASRIEALASQPATVGEVWVKTHMDTGNVIGVEFATPVDRNELKPTGESDTGTRIKAQRFPVHGAPSQDGGEHVNECNGCNGHDERAACSVAEDKLATANAHVAELKRKLSEMGAVRTRASWAMEERDQVRADIDACDFDLYVTRGKLKSALTRIGELEREIEVQRTLIANRDAEWLSIRAERDAANALVAELEKRDLYPLAYDQAGQISTAHELLTGASVGHSINLADRIIELREKRDSALTRIGELEHVNGVQREKLRQRERDNHALQDEVTRLNHVVYDLNCQSTGHKTERDAARDALKVANANSERLSRAADDSQATVTRLINDVTEWVKLNRTDRGALAFDRLRALLDDSGTGERCPMCGSTNLQAHVPTEAEPMEFRCADCCREFMGTHKPTPPASDGEYECCSCGTDDFARHLPGCELSSTSPALSVIQEMRDSGEPMVIYYAGRIEAELRGKS